MGKLKKTVDVVYAIASKLGGVGIGSIAQNALLGIENSNLSYMAFCRGYFNNVNLKKGNLSSYGFLEYLSYPFRFLEKYIGIHINSFVLVNNLLSRLIKQKLPPCEIYHTWIGFGYEAISKAKRNGAILVLEGANSHPLYSTQIMNEEYKKYGLSEYVLDAEGIEDMKEKYKIYNEFDYVMCPSDFVYDSFLKFGFSKKQLIKSSYGVDVNRFTPGKNKDDKFRLIFTGSLQMRKGIQYLLQAWDELKLKNAELIIIGRTWPDAQKIVKKYQNNKSIKFIGFFPNPEKYLRESSVFVSAAIEEGSALTAYEAMACGLPLIVTYNTGSVMRDGKDGLMILAGDVEDLKEKILYMYNNPDKRRKMGRSARKRVEKFSWDKYRERLVKFYKKILTKNKRYRNIYKVKVRDRDAGKFVGEFS